MTNRRSRVTEAPAFVLHCTPWRETSLVARVFARDYGIVTVVAKGAKRPYSGLRSVLMAFQPLLLSWSGMAETKTLIQAEVASIHRMPGPALMSCWYMNELLLKLLPAEDPHPVLFDAYAQALGQLVEGCVPAATLRQFEWCLLRETGYGVDGPMPDAWDGTTGSDLKGLFRDRLLAQIPGGRLVSRQVLLSLVRTIEANPGSTGLSQPEPPAQ
jgi:DNA repair protein RecO (recombination protein O)